MAQVSSKSQTKKVRKSVVKKLGGYFLRNGYLRLPNEKLEKERAGDYRKGYEIRFVANNKNELKEIKSLLKEADLKPGKHFEKFNQFVLPVYGKESFFRFKSLLAEQKIRIKNHKV